MLVLLLIITHPEQDIPIHRVYRNRRRLNVDLLGLKAKGFKTEILEMPLLQ